MYTSITTSASSQPSSSPTRSTTGSLNWARGSSLRDSFFISSTACLIPSIPPSSYHGCVVSREGPGIDLIRSVYCPVVPPAATRDAANQDSCRHPDNVESTEHSRAMASQLATITAEFAGAAATPTGIMANASGEPTSGTSRPRFRPHSARCDCDQTNRPSESALPSNSHRSSLSPGTGLRQVRPIQTRSYVRWTGYGDENGPG